MKIPNQFPVTANDLAEKLPSGSAEKLRAFAFPNMSIEEAHNTIAKLFGYRNFKDLKRQAYRLKPRPLSELQKYHLYVNVYMKVTILLGGQRSKTDELMLQLGLKHYSAISAKWDISKRPVHDFYAKERSWMQYHKSPATKKGTHATTIDIHVVIKSQIDR
jgi:hypothetical protein